MNILINLALFMFFMVSIFVTSLAWGQNEAQPEELSSVAHIPGPNCWNQALISMGLLKINRFTSAEEFDYLVKKNCSLVDKPKIGTLGRMKNSQKDVHAFIWLSDTEVFAKNSMGAFESPSVMPNSEMLKTYLFDEACLKNTKIPNDCRRDISYYECKPSNRKTLNQQKSLKSLELSLNELIYSFETMARPRMKCNDDSIFQRYLKLQNFLSLLKDFKHKEVEDEEYLKTWLRSPELQIDEIEYSSYFENCLDKDYINNFKIFKKIKLELKTLTNL